MPSGKYVRSAEARRNIGLASKGRKVWNKGKKNTLPSEIVLSIKEKMRNRMKDPAERNKARETSLKNWDLVKQGKLIIRRSKKDGVENPSWFKGGDAHKGWRGGTTPESVRLCISPDYVQWRNKVFRRDKFTCQECGSSGKGNLEAHHIKRFSSYPNLRFDITNGLTLCVDCHKKTKNYGRK